MNYSLRTQYLIFKAQFGLDQKKYQHEKIGIKSNFPQKISSDSIANAFVLLACDGWWIGGSRDDINGVT